MNYRAIRACFAIGALSAAAASTVMGADALDKGGQRDPLFLTATNGVPNNYLAVINTKTKATSFVPTGGSGGVSGNAGGVAVEGDLAAAVNFSSTNVTIFVRAGNNLKPTQMIQTASQPVSVAFGHNHLLVLGQTTAESFPVYGTTVGATNDGMITLLHADKSAGQIVSFDGGAMYDEKSGDVVAVPFGEPGLVGPNLPLALPPAPNNSTPLGMVARGPNVYLSVAHSDLQVLYANQQLISTAAGPMPYRDSSGNLLHAPCWNTLHGQFLYSADSPGKQLLRYLVSDSNIFYDKPNAAVFSGPPTDLDARAGMLAVIDGGDGVNSNASLFDIDSEGELKLRFSVKIPGPINGAVIQQ